MPHRSISNLQRRRRTPTRHAHHGAISGRVAWFRHIWDVRTIFKWFVIVASPIYIAYSEYIYSSWVEVGYLAEWWTHHFFDLNVLPHLVQGWILANLDFGSSSVSASSAIMQTLPWASKELLSSNWIPQTSHSNLRWCRRRISRNPHWSPVSGILSLIRHFPASTSRTLARESSMLRMILFDFRLLDLVLALKREC